ncbi:MAG: hypothetical protein WCX23_02545 [Candidatus Paceibacterota bacterium]|nr:hypothetical protein [Candidatus Paceibacterota bacterium]MDD4875021.1 hypothetical protein [Candidatus Paceibacterota bacterium]
MDKRKDRDIVEKQSRGGLCPAEAEPSKKEIVWDKRKTMLVFASFRSYGEAKAGVV